MTQPRTGQAATALATGDVLVTGGEQTVIGEPTGTAELFTPPVLADSGQRPARPAGHRHRQRVLPLPPAMVRPDRAST